MDFILNFLIVICLVTTFLVLMMGLFHSARSGDKEEKIKSICS